MGASARLLGTVFSQILLLISLSSATVFAERLCDPAKEDCRKPLLSLINNETQSIDVAFWFIEDKRYTDAIIARRKAGVPVRVLFDLRANVEHPTNAQLIADLKAAGIPLRYATTSGILHWKAMVFGGQHRVEFSGANYSPWALVYSTEYSNYVDEAIFFSDDPAVVNSFQTRFDSLWIDDTRFKDYANVTRPLTRRFSIFTVDPELNFVPGQNYAYRAVKLYNAEAQKIDVIMYRITDRRHTDAIIAAVGRGIPVRLLTEPQQYRDATRYWHSWNIDRMYMAKVKIRNRAHDGLNHQKLVLLYGQGTSIFGSSNWTSASASSQLEHNYFTRKGWIFQWFVDQFERKWFNQAGITETTSFTPQPPTKPTYVSPAAAASGVPTTGMLLKWKPGYWAHKADIYFGTSSTPPLVQKDFPVRPKTTASYPLPTLQSGRTYFWRIVSKTMANKVAGGSLRSFTTQ